jgi:outer membrane protein TolC
MPRPSLVTALVTAANLIVLGVADAQAQPQAAMISPEQAAHGPAPTTYRVTLEQARQQVLSNSKLLKLAALNVQSKGHATSAARADYFPKIVGNTVYMHFTDSLGKPRQRPTRLPRLTPTTCSTRPKHAGSPRSIL